MTMTTFTGGGGTQNSTLRGFYQSNEHDLKIAQNNSTITNIVRLKPRNDGRFSQPPCHPAFTHHVIAHEVSQSPRAKNRPAFTLAEVLITLGIIGIVAAMTLPGLIQRQQEKITVNRLKKTYSTLQQAFIMAIQEHGPVNDWCTVQSADDYVICTVSIQEKLKPYLKNIKHCKRGGNKYCFSNVYKNRFNDLTVVINSQVLTYVILDGTSIGYKAQNGDQYPSRWCTSKDGRDTHAQDSYFGYCGIIYVDINGQQGPNRDGDDIFTFKLYQNVLKPMGGPDDRIWVETFDAQCLGKNWNRSIGACTAWVIYNENMDYLHCPDKLGWGNGKAKSCKTAQ